MPSKGKIMALENLRDKLRRYFWFTPVEWSGFVVMVLVLSFVYSFDKWSVDLFVGLTNWFWGVLLFGAIVFVHHAVQRVAALYYGFQPENLVWWYGLVGSVLLVIFSNGVIKVYAVSGLMIHLLPAHRLGRFRYGPNIQTFANIAALGLVANVCAAAFVKTLSWFLQFPQVFVDEWFMQSLIFAVWNLLPIPPLDGSRMLYGSRLFYVFVLSTLVGYVFLVLAGIYSFVLALLIGVLGWFLFYYYVERER